MLKPMVMTCALFVAACGGQPARPVPTSIEGWKHGAPSAAMNDPVEVLRALAQAARDDDGPALDALVHPTHGMWLWDQPGATVSPSVHVKAGSAEAPTAHLVASGMNDYWKASYWKHVAGGLDALARMDREPADRYAAVYGDCGEEETQHDLRAWLAAKDDFSAAYGMLFEDSPAPYAPALAGAMTHFHVWGLDVWLVEDRGRLWVAHVMVWTPCDA